MIAMKKIVLAVSLIAAVTTVEGRNPLHGPPHSNETNNDGPDSIHGHHKVFEMSNPNSLNEDELYQLADFKNQLADIKNQLADFKTHKMISDIDFQRQIDQIDFDSLSAEEKCQYLDPVDGFCIESGDHCNLTILILTDHEDGHCCCCCGPSVHITTPPPTTPPPPPPPGCCDECERMEGICINNNGHCDGIIKIMEVDNEHCCCCIKQDTICPEPFEEIGGCCYYFNFTEVGWEDARNGCHAMQRRRENVELAEVGRNECNDVLVMDAVARKGASSNWFGALTPDGGATWIWQHTEREFSKHSNMWLPSMPGNQRGDCVMAMNVDEGPELRAYFRVNNCNDIFGYTCQIFGVINNISD